MTLNLSTGDVMGNLTGAIVESIAVTTASGGADCKYKARVKVSLCSNRKRLCRPQTFTKSRNQITNGPVNAHLIS